MRFVFSITGKVILLIILLTSCRGRTDVEFVIHNKSQVAIDSVIVSTSSKDSRVSISNIDPSSDKSDFLDMENVAIVDGDYFVQIVVDSITYENKIGYFTNGSPSEKKIEIWYSTDSIRYKQTARD